MKTKEIGLRKQLWKSQFLTGFSFRAQYQMIHWKMDQKNILIHPVLFSFWDLEFLFNNYFIFSSLLQPSYTASPREYHLMYIFLKYPKYIYSLSTHFKHIRLIQLNLELMKIKLDPPHIHHLFGQIRFSQETNPTTDMNSSNARISAQKNLSKYKMQLQIQYFNDFFLTLQKLYKNTYLSVKCLMA